MRKILGILVLVVTFMVPTQLVFAVEEDVLNEMNYQVQERMTMSTMKMDKLRMHLLKNRKHMSKAQMQRIMNALDSIDREVTKLME